MDEVKKQLDLMAFHKLNVFHWHLVDGHGWRLEIKKNPRLCAVAETGWSPRERPPFADFEARLGRE